MRWVMQPFALRRLYAAALRVGAAERRGKTDDMALRRLRQCRQAALDRHDENVVDDWAMDGLVAGRKTP